MSDNKAESSLWPQVKIHLRQLEDWEIPVGLEQPDSRMVEFYKKSKGLPYLYNEIGYYYPLRTPELLEQFLATFGGRAPSDKKIADFYRRFGPLRDFVIKESKCFPAWAEQLGPEAQEQLSDPARLLRYEPVWWLQEKAQELKTTMEFYHALKENQLAKLHRLIGGEPPGKRIIGLSLVGNQLFRYLADPEPNANKSKAGSFSISEEVFSPGQQVQKLSDERCRFLAANLLAGQLNLGETNSERRWQVTYPIGQETPRNHTLELLLGRRIDSLLVALYLQLGELVEKTVSLNRCPNCQRLFYPRRTNQEYCEKFCGDATRQRRYYIAQKKKAARKRRS